MAKNKVADNVYNALRERILNLEYKPGRGLSAASLSNELGVSRAPVREALLRLSHEGLVEIFPKSGSRVSLIDLDKVTEERFLRKNLETAAVLELINNHAFEHLPEMENLVALQLQAWEQQRVIDFLMYDNAFHGLIFKAINKYRCWELIMAFCPNEHRLRLLSTWVITGTSHSVVSNHQDLIEALRNKDREDALRIENQHLSRIIEETAKLVTMYPSIFKADGPWIPSNQNSVPQTNIRTSQADDDNFLASIKRA